MRVSICAARASAPRCRSWFCTGGYGEYHPGAGTYHFDFTDEKRYRIQGPEIDYYFYYGPTPKEIFEEHNLHANHPDPWSVASERFGSWATLKASLLRMVHGAMSARDCADVQPGGVQHGAARTTGAGAATGLAGGARHRRGRWG